MSDSVIFSENFLRYNDQQTKNLCIVVDIPGVDLLTSSPIFTRIRYGDPHLFYGDGDVYGGMRLVENVRSLLDMRNGSVTIQQRNEPEQGRAAIAQISLSFVDKDEYMTQVISPGILIPEIMGVSVRVLMGYQQTSYPEDYTVIFRGVVTSVEEPPGNVMLQFSDPNFNRRENVFTSQQTVVSSAIDAVIQTIPVIDCSQFPQMYLGPDGLYDIPSPWNQNGTFNPFATRRTGVRTFFLVDDEWMEYGPLGIQSTPFAIVESLKYEAIGAAAGITIRYTTGGTAGAEVVSILPNTNEITVQIESGVSTANQIITAINASAAAGIVTVAVATGFSGSDPQIAILAIGVSPGFSGVLRGARGTTATPHDAGATASSAVEFTDACMTMALKLMLSGWSGPWISDVPIFSIVQTTDAVLLAQAGAIILPNKIDALKDYGLTTGDYVTISGSGIPGNNVTARITRFADMGAEPNRIVYTNNLSLMAEYPTTATVAFRSQYDTYPTYCAVALTPEDVDVQAHQDLASLFLNQTADMYQFFLTDEQALKTFIETEIYFPVSAYSLTRRGQLSVGMTKPPIAGETLIFLNKNNVIDPVNIKPNRSLNNRKFFNEVDYTYDFDDAGDSMGSLVVLDSNSLSRIGVSMVLPVAATGVRSKFGTVALLQKRAQFFLSRYRFAATILDIKCNWQAGCQIEAGDVIAIVDNGDLKIANFNTGTRDIGTQLWEVIDRSLSFKDGNCQLQVISGVGSDITDRFGVIAPSSNVVAGSNSFLEIEDSFGAKYPGDEMRKWRDYADQPIQLHDQNYTVTYDTTIVGFDTADNYKMFISGFTVVPPSFAGLIMDIPYYPDDGKKLTNSIYKAIHVFFSPHVAITGGVGLSQTQFTVGGGDIDKFFIGAPVRVFNAGYLTANLTDILVNDITGLTITLAKPLGFVPDSTFMVEGLGFNDKTGTYRLF